MADDERNALLKILMEHRDTSLKHWEIVSDRMGLMEGSISSVKTDIADVKTDIADVKTDVANVKKDMAENTEMTRVLADAKTAGRVFTKIIAWVGTIALAVGSTVWAFKEAIGHNDITPGP